MAHKIEKLLQYFSCHSVRVSWEKTIFSGGSKSTLTFRRRFYENNLLSQNGDKNVSRNFSYQRIPSLDKVELMYVYVNKVQYYTRKLYTE